MRRSLFHRRHAGFLLLEVMLGIGVLGTFLSGIGLSLLLGQEHTIMAGDRMRAVSLAQSALEAARTIRDDDFDTLLSAVGAGEVGVALTGDMKWQLSSPTTDAQGFRTALTVQQEGDGHVRIQAETKWKRGYNRSGSVLIATHLTDWRALPPIGNWATVSVQGSGSIAGVVPMFTAAAVSGDYLFATSENGDGLYVIDLAHLSNPQLETSVPLSASGLALAIRGDRLYVLTDDDSAELRVFDISDPTAPVALLPLNLSREGRARSLAFWENALLVGMTALGDPGVDELFRINVSNNPPVVLDSINIDDADILGIAVSGTSALLATSNVGAEFQVADVRATTLSLTTEGYNVTDEFPGRSIAAANRVAVLGRTKNPKSLVRFDLTDQGFVYPTSDPPTHDVGGDVNGLDMDANACVTFAAVGNHISGYAFQTVNMTGASLASLGELNKDAGDGRAVVYDSDRDRAYLLTDDAWYVLRPGTGTLDPSCP